MRENQLKEERANVQVEGMRANYSIFVHLFCVVWMTICNNVRLYKYMHDESSMQIPSSS